MVVPISITGNIHFRIRFNTTHGNTDLYWRVLINDEEYLVRSLECLVATYSDKSFDKNAGTVKFHIAGNCTKFSVNTEGSALFS